MTSIIKPKNDERIFKYIILPNKIKCLLVNSKTEISSVSLLVESGFYSDPIDVQGLSHFLEHMLFMGTEKYPEVNYFHKFINENAGNTNAETNEQNTNYYYQIIKEKFVESLDIFSHFFINPLFDSNAVYKEINAINSEHLKNMSNEYSNINGVLRDIAATQTKHPYYNFGTGTTEILNQKNIRDRLIEFYNTHYSANIMNLVLISDHSIETLEELAVEYFGQIKNKNIKKFEFIGEPFVNPSMDIFIKTQTNEEMLMFAWQIPNSNKLKRYTMEYISSVLKNGCEDGLYDWLIVNNYVRSFDCYMMDIDSSNIIYVIEILPTNKGKKYFGTIRDAVFSYINGITVQEFVYKEQQQIKQIVFENDIEPTNMEYARILSRGITSYSSEYVNYGDFYMPDYNTHEKESIENILNILKNKQITIWLSKNIKDKNMKKIEWYNTFYSFNTLEYQTSDEKYNLRYQEPNPFATTNMDILEFRNMTYPEYDSQYHIIYHKDGKRKDATAYCTLILDIKNMYSFDDLILLKIFMKCIFYECENEFYYAGQFNSYVSYRIYKNCVIFNFNGYADKFIKWVNYVINKIFKSKITKHSFTNVINNFVHNLKNPNFSSLIQLSHNIMQSKLVSEYRSDNELIDYVSKLKFSNILHGRKMLNEMTFRLFLAGNIDENMIKGIKIHLKETSLLTSLDTLQKTTHNTFCSKLIKYDVVNMKTLLLNDGDKQMYFYKNPDESEKNNFIKVFFEINTTQDDVERYTKSNLLSLLDSYLEEKFFTQLRTIEQLGYIVRAGTETYNAINYMIKGFSFMIQSNNLQPQQLKKRIKLFIKNKYEELKLVSENEFDKWISMKIKLYNVPKNFYYQDYNMFLSEIFQQRNIINQKKELINNIKTLKLNDLVNFYYTYLLGPNKKVRVVQIYGMTNNSV